MLAYFRDIVHGLSMYVMYDICMYMYCMVVCVCNECNIIIYGYSDVCMYVCMVVNI